MSSKGKGKQRDFGPDPASVIEVPDSPVISTAKTEAEKAPSKPVPEPLSAFTCPICFSPPMNATVTPCGHICCGECLFTAVKTTMQRAATNTRSGEGGPRCA